MSHRVSMMLGPFPFEAHGRGYQDVARQVGTPWVDIAVAQGLNQQQWTGPTSEEVTISGVLFPVEFPASVAGIVAAANSGQPMFLVSGDADEGIIHGRFTVQSIDEDRSFHDAGGRAQRNAYTIKLKRYGSAGRSGGLVGVLSNLLW
jgi:phage protein U